MSKFVSSESWWSMSFVVFFYFDREWKLSMHAITWLSSVCFNRFRSKENPVCPQPSIVLQVQNHGLKYHSFITGNQKNNWVWHKAQPTSFFQPRCQPRHLLLQLLHGGKHLGPPVWRVLQEDGDGGTQETRTHGRWVELMVTLVGGTWCDRHVNWAGLIDGRAFRKWAICNVSKVCAVSGQSLG